MRSTIKSGLALPIALLVVGLAICAWVNAGTIPIRGTGDDSHVYAVRIPCEGIMQMYLKRTGAHVHMTYDQYKAMTDRIHECNEHATPAG